MHQLSNQRPTPLHPHRRPPWTPEFIEAAPVPRSNQEHFHETDKIQQDRTERSESPTSQSNDCQRRLVVCRLHAVEHSKEERLNSRRDHSENWMNLNLISRTGCPARPELSLRTHRWA